MIVTDKQEEILELLNELPVSFQEDILKMLRDIKAKKDDADFFRNFGKILAENEEVLRKLAQ